MTNEGERYRRHPSEPVCPIPLPPELADFLAQQGAFACVTQATDKGVAHVLKAPAAEIVRARGTVPVHVQHALIDHPSAPVIRTVLSIYDVPRHPLRFESFINVAEPSQRQDFAALAEQEFLMLLFYDEALRHRLSKLVPNNASPAKPDDTIPTILRHAARLAAAIPAERFDFDTA